MASLFGDVNELMPKDLSEDKSSRKKVILYPEEIILSKTSGIEATVKKAWFKGETWLIEASLNGKTLYFNHSQELKEDQKIKLKVSEKLIESRLK